MFKSLTSLENSSDMYPLSDRENIATSFMCVGQPRAHGFTRHGFGFRARALIRVRVAFVFISDVRKSPCSHRDVQACAGRARRLSAGPLGLPVPLRANFRAIVVGFLMWGAEARRWALSARGRRPRAVTSE